MEATDEADETEKAEAVTDPEHEPATEILLSPEAQAQLPAEDTKPQERRFTAPSGFDGSTQNHRHAGRSGHRGDATGASRVGGRAETRCAATYSATW